MRGGGGPVGARNGPGVGERDADGRSSADDASSDDSESGPSPAWNQRDDRIVRCGCGARRGRASAHTAAMRTSPCRPAAHGAACGVPTARGLATARSVATARGVAPRRVPPPARSLKDDNGIGHRHDWRVDDMHSKVLQYFDAWSGKVGLEMRRLGGLCGLSAPPPSGPGLPPPARSRVSCWIEHRVRRALAQASRRPTATPTPTPLQADAATVASTLLDDASFVHIDEVWAGAEVVTGAKGFTKFVAATRASYPDLAITVEDYGPAGPHRLFVRWTGAATNLGARHGHTPSRHSSALSGIDLFTFTPDRAAITEVLVYRTPLAEDVAELAERVAGVGGDAHELRLKRLVDKSRD